jgi:hypothetical protein
VALALVVMFAVVPVALMARVWVGHHRLISLVRVACIFELITRQFEVLERLLNYGVVAQVALTGIGEQ